MSAADDLLASIEEADSAGGGSDDGLLPLSGAPSPADDLTDAQPSGDPVRDARLHRVSQEASRYRVAAKTEKDRADIAETRVAEVQATVRDLRLHNAFLVAASGRVRDLDAAWKLADLSAVSVENDGTVGSVDDVITDILLRYPYLAPEDPVPVFQPPPIEASGRPLNARRNAKGDASRQVLETKFPALKRLR